MIDEKCKKSIRIKRPKEFPGRGEKKMKGGIGEIDIVINGTKKKETDLGNQTTLQFVSLLTAG